MKSFPQPQPQAPARRDLTDQRSSSAPRAQGRKGVLNDERSTR